MSAVICAIRSGCPPRRTSRARCAIRVSDAAAEAGARPLPVTTADPSRAR